MMQTDFCTCLRGVHMGRRYCIPLEPGRTPYWEPMTGHAYYDLLTGGPLRDIIEENKEQLGRLLDTLR